MKPSTLLGAVTVLAAGFGIAQQGATQQTSAPLGARLKMHWKDASVSFREAASEHEIALRDYFHAVRLDKVILQSAKEANGFTYLLLDVTGPSKLPRDSHRCGGGNESDLIWLKLDGNWKVVAEKDFQYDSCWTSAAMVDPPKWQGDTLKAATIEKVATYSYKRPDEGLRVSEAPADK
jgi:hypothetical protein